MRTVQLKRPWTLLFISQAAGVTLYKLFDRLRKMAEWPEDFKLSPMACVHPDLGKQFVIHDGIYLEEKQDG